MAKEEYKNIDIFLNRKRKERQEELFISEPYPQFTQEREREREKETEREKEKKEETEEYLSSSERLENIKEDFTLAEYSSGSSLFLEKQEDDRFEENLEQQLQKERNRFDQETIVIFNFAKRSSLAQSIALQTRELRVYSEIYDFSGQENLESNTFLKKLKRLNLKGIILCGEEHTFLSSEEKQRQQELCAIIFSLNLPVLGIGSILSEITRFFGGKVSTGQAKNSLKEESFSSNQAKLFLDPDSPLFSGIESEIRVSIVGSNEVSALPQGFKVIAHTSRLPIAGISASEKRVYALQVDPYTFSNNSKLKELLANFLHQICDCQVSWNHAKIKELCMRNIQAQTQNGKVFFEFKNNLESLALCLIMNEAIGQRFSCVLIDHGLCHHSQNKKLVQFLRNSFRMKAYYIDAREFFFRELENISEDEQKKLVIRRLSQKILHKKISEIGNFDFLADQSTYPELLSESESFCQRPRFTLNKKQLTQFSKEENKLADLTTIRPFAKLFESELKELVGAVVTKNMLSYLESPLPEEGFACSIVGKVTPQKIELITQANTLLQAELPKESKSRLELKLEETISSSEVSKNYFLIIKAKEKGFNSQRISSDFLEKISFRFMNEIPSITKIFYDLSPV